MTMWRVRWWDRGRQGWYGVGFEYARAEAETEVRRLASMGRVAAATNGTEHMRCYPAHDGRPLTFVHTGPVTATDTAACHRAPGRLNQRNDAGAHAAQLTT